MSIRSLVAGRVVAPEFRPAFRSLGRGSIAIDCGANIGTYTNVMVASGARVFAFEPNPDACAFLRRRLGRRRNLTIYEQAVSDHDGNERLYLHEQAAEDPLEWSVGASLVADKGNVDPGSFVEVQTVDFDAFVAEVGDTQLVKMDVEGAELPILRKLLRTGRIELIHHLLVELHDKQIPSLAAEADAVRAAVRERRLTGVRLDWD